MSNFWNIFNRKSSESTQPPKATRPVELVEMPEVEESPRVIPIEDADEEVAAPAPVPAPVPAPEPLSKLERLVKHREAVLAKKAEGDKEFDSCRLHTDILKADYVRMANDQKSEAAKLSALAKEIRLAQEAADKAWERANKAKESYENMADAYAESILDMKQRNEAFADSLLEEFGC